MCIRDRANVQEEASFGFTLFPCLLCIHQPHYYSCSCLMLLIFARLLSSVFCKSSYSNVVNYNHFKLTSVGVLLLTIKKEIAGTCLQIIFTSLCCLNYHFSGSQLVENWVGTSRSKNEFKQRKTSLSFLRLLHFSLVLTNWEPDTDLSLIHIWRCRRAI